MPQKTTVLFSVVFIIGLALGALVWGIGVPAISPEMQPKTVVSVVKTLGTDGTPASEKIGELKYSAGGINFVGSAVQPSNATCSSTIRIDPDTLGPGESAPVAACYGSLGRNPDGSYTVTCCGQCSKCPSGTCTTTIPAYDPDWRCNICGGTPGSPFCKDTSK